MPAYTPFHLASRSFSFAASFRRALALVAWALALLGVTSASRAQDVLLPLVALAPIDMPDLAAEPDGDVAFPAMPPDFVEEDRGWIRFQFPASERSRVVPLIDAADAVRTSFETERLEISWPAGDELGRGHSGPA